MTSRFVSVLIAAALAAPGQAFAGMGQDPATPVADPVEFEIVRAGDPELACDALVAETTDLNTQVIALQTQVQADVARNASMMGGRPDMGGVGMGLATTVASFIPGVNLLVGAAAFVQQQSQQAAARRLQNEMTAQRAAATEQVAAIDVRARRAAHLSDLMIQKSC